MISKPLDQIKLEDIKDLIDNQVQEDKNIDYKESLPGNSDGDKKEFLADISSFANVNGGDIIFGIKEKRDEKNNSTGLPEEIVGLEFNFDQEKQRLENIILDGIKPRIYISFWSIDFKDGKQLLIIRIPKSWNSPHLIEFQKSRKFFSRNSSGKYQLDVDEIKNAFLVSEALGEKIRNFRIDRINKILTNNSPIPLDSSARLVLHLIPLDSFSRVSALDISTLELYQTGKLSPIAIRGYNIKFNFDGLLRYDVNAYLQLFRNGIIETTINMTYDGNISQSYFEKRIVESVTDYIEALKGLNINPPIAAMLSYVNVKQNRLGYGYEVGDEISENVLSPSEIIIDNGNIPNTLKSIFDTLANASGYARSLSYNEKGEWVSYR